MKHIAKRLHKFDSSAFRNVIELQSHLKNPVDLSVGIPEELTPEHSKQAGIKAINNNHTTYTQVNGIPPLRKAIVRKLAAENNIDATIDEVTVVPGLSTAVLLVFMTVLNPDDQVIIFDPYYPAFPPLAKLVNAIPVFIDTFPSYVPNVKTIEKKITKKTKAIVINSPNNPTGVVYDENLLRKIAKVAKKHDLLIITDEIYEKYVYDGSAFSIGSIYKNTLTLNGFSKSYSMTGWRLGYIHGPQELIEAINELQQYIVFSSSSIAQHAALTALSKKINLVYKYKQKRDYLIKRLKQLNYQVYGGEGAYYLFLKVPNNMTEYKFIEAAAKKNLLILPGSAFTKRRGYFRVSYGGSINSIKKGANIISTLQ